jgi:hypothetical protein
MMLIPKSLLYTPFVWVAGGGWVPGVVGDEQGVVDNEVDV